ncbi:MAG: 3-oxoacyl-ACP synthase, partial [Alphaproteobacteria bacterium]|nr:3-oxoacyl-ACP synthase [Alphaproteobacteria bacterium]
MVQKTKITGIGAYLPKNIITNNDLSKILDTSDAWIQSRSGIQQRHQADEGETTSDLAVSAAKAALAHAKLT